MSQASTDLRVFISSTFRDLQREREHLVRKVFPEIRALCRERGVTFTEVDLRWGLTDEQAMLGHVVRTCLEEVDRCRPYFIGILGNRYGWVPALHEILMDPDLLARYSWIEELAFAGASVTEMEIVHGVFNRSPLNGDSAFFYHRNGDAEDSDDSGRVEALIDRLRTAGTPIRAFSDVEELGDAIRSDLLAMIDRTWPASEAPTPLELERRSHGAFAASRRRAYIPDPGYLKEFSGWLATTETPLLLSAESGLGKSSLVVFLVDQFRRKNPDGFVIEHYVGASVTSGSAPALMRHLIGEIRERFSVDEPVPLMPEEITKSFPNWLFRAAHRATEEGVPMFVAIDAINQLGGADTRLGWLPGIIPPGIRLLISTTPGESLERLRERGWRELAVAPLVDERVRQSIVVRYLSEFHKSIGANQLRRLTADDKARSPLYLRVVAEELRLHGEHETLDTVIENFTSAGDLEEVFQRLLARLEVDHGRDEVERLLGLILVSRAGLSEMELLELTGSSRLELSRLLFALDYHLIRHDGLFGFFHDYLRHAVHRRYLDDEGFARSLEIAETLDAAHSCCVILGNAAIVHLRRNDIDTALEYSLRALEIARTEGNLYETAGKLHNIANAYDTRGDRETALGYFEEARQINESIGNRQWLAYNLMSMALIYRDQGDVERAAREFEQAIPILDQLGDRLAYGIGMGNLGIIYGRLDRDDEALTCLATAMQEHLSSRFLHGQTYWLFEKALVLHRLCSRPDDLPGYLSAHVRDMDRTAILHEALALVESSIDLCRRLDKHDIVDPSIQLREQIRQALGERGEDRAGGGKPSSEPPTEPEADRGIPCG